MILRGMRFCDGGQPELSKPELFAIWEWVNWGSCGFDDFKSAMEKSGYNWNSDEEAFAARDFQIQILERYSHRIPCEIRYVESFYQLPIGKRGCFGDCGLKFTKGTYAVFVWGFPYCPECALNLVPRPSIPDDLIEITRRIREEQLRKKLRPKIRKTKHEEGFCDGGQPEMKEMNTRPKMKVTVWSWRRFGFTKDRTRSGVRLITNDPRVEGVVSNQGFRKETDGSLIKLGDDFKILKGLEKTLIQLGYVYKRSSSAPGGWMFELECEGLCDGGQPEASSKLDWLADIYLTLSRACGVDPPDVEIADRSEYCYMDVIDASGRIVRHAGIYLRREFNLDEALHEFAHYLLDQLWRSERGNTRAFLASMDEATAHKLSQGLRKILKSAGYCDGGHTIKYTIHTGL